jgi:hypothetical protein
VGFKYVLGATPEVEYVSLQLKLFDFLDGAPIDVAHSNLEPLTLLGASSAVRFLRLFWGIFPPSDFHTIILYQIFFIL